MKTVVNAVHAIIDDVRSVEARPPKERLDYDIEDLQSLRERADMTLSNLVVAARTHATSLGMSPVSLLDAAASHVSSAITEIGKTVQVRKATRAEQDSFNTPTSPMGMNATNGYAPTLRSVNESAGGHMRNVSGASSARGEDYDSSATRTNGRHGDLSPTPTTSGRNPSTRRPPSEPSSSNASSPPAIFDTPPRTNLRNGPGSDESAPTEGPDDAWAELKVHDPLSITAFAKLAHHSRILKLSQNLSSTLFKVCSRPCAVQHRRLISTRI
jgi:protein SPA2